MANIDLTVQDLARSVVLTTSYQAGLSIADTYFVPNDGNVFLHFKKTGAGACNVTMVTPGVADGLAIADPVGVVPASTGDVMLGPFRPETFNDPATGEMSFTLSEITGLSVGRFRLPR